MSSFVPPPPVSDTMVSRSFGTKFFIILLLAFVMSLSGLFVDSLTEDRAAMHGVAAAAAGTAAQPATILGVRLADSYRSMYRSLHYIPLFLGLVFLAYFLFEVLTERSVHPAQYALVGVAQTVFYLLLLSLSEHLGFDWSFLVAGAATIALLAINADWVFRNRRLAWRAFGVFSLLYAFIYVLLRVERYALLVGAFASFAAVAAAMYITRNVDWYANGGVGSRLRTVRTPAGSQERESWLL